MKTRIVHPLRQFATILALSAILGSIPFPATYAAAPQVVLTVTTAADSGPGSLRQAILDANSNPGMDWITFNISAPGVQTITPLSALSTITEPVVIDGYTQPGASQNTLDDSDNAVLLVELDGSSAGFSDGLVITAGKTTIRGLVINRFTGSGIKIEANGANRIEGNFIGTDPRGIADRGNGQFGVWISGSSNNTVGGTDVRTRNVISGNDVSGIYLAEGAAGNRVQGNFIGPDSSGGADLGNSFDGITIYNAASNTIGGTGASKRNIISANDGNGVQILGGGATGNQLQGNFIGTKANGVGSLGNNWHGVSVDFLASNNSIGGTSSGAGNRIASNGAHGVSIASGTGNAILSNSIFSNAGLGIDLGNDGVTPNDPCDTDTGANNRQNTPQLRLVSASGGGLTIEVKLDVVSSTTYRIEFFSSDVCDPTGFGEGQTMITSVSVVSGASCLQTFNVLFGPGIVPAGHVVTATLTDPAGNTSEFSNCVMTP